MYNIFSDFFYILKGFASNLGICVVTISFGFVFGFIIAFNQFVFNKSIKSKLYTQLVSVICGAPLIIQLAIYAYSVTPLFNVFLSKISFLINFIINKFIIYSCDLKIDKIWWCFFCISVNSACYFSLIFLDSMQSIDEEYFLNLQGLNISKSLSIRKFLLPTIINNSYNKITFEFIALLKETSVLSLIGVSDVFFRCRETAMINNMYFTYMTICACIFYFSFLIYKNFLHKYFNKFLVKLLKYSLDIFY